MDIFKMFNKEFYLNKIQSEIDELVKEISSLCLQAAEESANILKVRNTIPEVEYEKLKRKRANITGKIRTKQRKLKRLREDYERYKSMDIWL